MHGNAFPSAHVAGALPPLIFAWRHAPRLGAVVTLLVALMGLGAVYDGYHYASDVVAGVAVGAAAAAIVMAVQRIARVGPASPPAGGGCRGSSQDVGVMRNGRVSRGAAGGRRSSIGVSKARPTRLPAGSSSVSSATTL